MSEHDTRSSAPRGLPWWRRPWIAVGLAAVALCALVIGLALRFTLEPPLPSELSDLRRLALIGGLGAAFLARRAKQTQPDQVSRWTRWTLKLFPGSDQRQPPPTEAARRLLDVAAKVGLIACLGAAIWYAAAIGAWLASLVW